METEQTAEVTETVDGVVKTCLNMPNDEDHHIEKEEFHPELIIKQNGMSDHSELKQETGTEIQNHDKPDTDDALEANEIMNSENGQTVVNDTNDSNNENEDNKMKDSEDFSSSEKEILELSKLESSTVNLPNLTDKAEVKADSVHIKVEETLNDELNKIESNEDTEKFKAEFSADVDEKSINEDKKIESVDSSKQLGIDSEDSSKDSTDSSISNISKTSSPLKKEDDDGDSSLDAVKDDGGSDITTVMDSFKEELVEKEQEEADKVSRGDSDKSEKMEVSDVKENVVSDGSNEKEKGLSSETNETVNQSSNLANDTGVKHPVVQQPAVPLVVPMSSVPYGMPLQQVTVHQQQTGYLTKVGNQHIFVPMSNASPGMYPVVSTPNTFMTGSHAKGQPPLKPAGAVPTEKTPDLSPKSSLEMIELMKWEMQNRVPDNYNWSVAFHPKKDELSSVSAFLLELGHDVVKEAVYKDIILIQTKKKDQGKLKETEVESLEKMKTVYENTKKKVEHLEMKTLRCHHCKYQTESKVVMNHHKDHPHVEPPWDWHNGYLCCAHCDFRTKQTAAFSFHMEAVHKAVAKMPDKPGQFPCEMCPLDLSTKNKLEKHRVKCMKTFKLNVNLQPYYHDVNFCMKTCYYKPKKLIAKPPPKKTEPRPQPQRNQPSRSTAHVVKAINAAEHVMGIRQTLMQPQFVPRAPPPLQRQPISLRPIIRAPQVAFRQVSPQVNRSPVVRQMIQQQKQSSAPSTPSPRPQSREMSGFEVCELCGGYVKDRQALRIHFYYAHKVEMPQTIFNRPAPPLTCDVCQSKFWTTQGLSKHKSTLRHYPNTGNASRSTTPTHKCFMCSRMVANLFIHVEQSHGMTMKELVAMKKCIMCGITASDRRQLEVHMSSNHGVLIKANDFLGPEKATPPSKSPVSIQPKPGTPVTTATPNKGKSMVRNNLCVFCQIQFADNIQLTMHCIKIHATCSACGMVVASSKHLQNHHCKKMMRDCVICGLKKLAPDAYALHIKKHVKPCSVNVDKMSDKSVKSTKENIKKNYKPAVISLDSDSGGESDVELVADDNDHKIEKESKKDAGKVQEISEIVELNESDNTPVKNSKNDSDDSAENLDKESKDDELTDKVDSKTIESVNETSAVDARNRKKKEASEVENREEKEVRDSESDQDVRDSESDQDVDESKNVNVESELGNDGETYQDDKNDSVNPELDNEDSESESASKIESNQPERRKRKNDSSDESDLEESKRQRTEADCDDKNVSVEDENNSEDNDNVSVENKNSSKENLYEDISDSESKDKETADSSHCNDNTESKCNNSNKDIDNTGSIKRPLEDDEMHESGADSGTESDQASKRRKVAEEND